MVGLSLALETRTGNQRFTFRDAARGLTAFSKGAISFEKLDPVIKRNMRLFLSEIAAAQKQRHGSPWPGGTGPTTLSKRSGALIRSIEESIRVEGNFSAGGDVRGQIGSPLVYAAPQEFGATIRPKRAQYLTVPLPAALNSNGTMKLPRARDYPNTFVAKSRKGNLIIFQKRGGKITPLFVLKKEVTLPPRLNLGVMVQAGSRALGEKVIADTLKAFNRGEI